MKHFCLLIALLAVGFINFGYSVTARAAGFEPIVAEFDADQAVKLKVGTDNGDSSWMSLIFETPIDPSVYPYLSVEFYIYRSSDSASNNERLSWAFDDGANFNPYSGRQDGAFTYPFVESGGTTGFAETVTGEYAAVALEWNFTAGTCSSWYAGDPIDEEFQLIDPPDNPAPLTSFTICLDNLDAADGEVAWIDNFSLGAWNDSDYIEYYYSFDDLELNALNGQGLTGSHWEAGTEVPIPGAVWLLGSGIMGMLVMRRRNKR